jgi:hypothetical protein
MKYSYLTFKIIFFITAPINLLISQDNNIIYSKYEYTMGDNDTKNDAKKICFIEAKRLCLEKAGTYIESNTQVENYMLSKDEIKSYAAAVLEVEIVSQEIKYIGNNFMISTTVKANIDNNYLTQKIRQIKEDKTLQINILNQQKQINILQNDLRNIQKKLATKDINDIQKRQERKEIFDQIDELENIRFKIKTITNLAINNVELGMTRDEVLKVAGKPRVSLQYDTQLNYGNVWVIFKGGIVSCIVDGKYWNINKSRENYSSNAIIK